MGVLACLVLDSCRPKVGMQSGALFRKAEIQVSNYFLSLPVLQLFCGQMRPPGHSTVNPLPFTHQK